MVSIISLLKNANTKSSSFRALESVNPKRKGVRRKCGSKISLIPFVLIFSLFLLIPSIAGYESGIDGGLGTNIADNGCFCHGVQNEEVVISVEMVGDVSEIVSGETYTIEIDSAGGPEEGGSAYGGFLLNIDNGNLVAINDEVGVNSEGDEATHSSLGNDQRTWLIEWVAGTGDLTEFTLRVNLVDGDGASGEGDDWNMANFYLQEDGTFTQTLIEPEARFNAPEWTQNLILVSSGILMIVLTFFSRPSKPKGRRRDFD